MILLTLLTFISLFVMTVILVISVSTCLIPDHLVLSLLVLKLSVWPGCILFTKICEKIWG